MNVMQYISANSYLNIADLVNIIVIQKILLLLIANDKNIENFIRNFYICISLQLLGGMVDKYSSDESYDIFFITTAE